MDDYREKVEQLARERTGEPFYNSSIDHAAVIIEKMFRHADREVCIISNRLNARVFGQEEVVKEARGFLSDTNHSVRILLEDEAETLSEGHPLVEELRQHPKSYEVRKIPQQLVDVLNYHFTLVDDDSYRFEPDKSKWEAVAVFGDKNGAAKMRTAFDAIWKASASIELPAVMA